MVHNLLNLTVHGEMGWLLVIVGYDFFNDSVTFRHGLLCAHEVDLIVAGAVSELKVPSPS
jgi:hypothetical protein